MAYTDKGLGGRAEVGQRADRLTRWVRELGKLVTDVNVATVWVTILEPTGAVKVARGQTGITIVDGGLQYQGDFSGWTLAEDYVAVWEYTLSDGQVRCDRQFFDVVRNKLLCVVSAEDVLSFYADANEHLAALGITDASSFVRSGWQQISNWIRARKNRPSLILDSQRLENPTLQSALYWMCLALTRDPSDIWMARMKEHAKQYDNELKQLGDLKYDIDEDGLAGDKETRRINRVRFYV